MSLNATVKHSGMDVSEVKVIYQRPATIQELSWRPSRFGSSDTDPVEQILFSFYNGQLFRMVVDYDGDKTNGLTSDDVIEAISAKYGFATKPGVPMALPSHFAEDTVQVAHAGKTRSIRSISSNSLTDRLLGCLYFPKT